jgi:hypothetical protein
MKALRRQLPIVTVALLALAATITSLGHDFTYDDKPVIFGNDRVHHLAGLWRLFGQTYWPTVMGGDGYRPVTMTLFTLQWAVAGGAPWVFHLGNILLAIGAALAVLWCARAVLPTLDAWIVAALFAVHPVHVEVTGNVVGQSELIVAICVLLAVGLYIRARRAGPLGWRTSAGLLALYAVALFTKEHAVVLPALLVAAELTVIPGGSWRERLRAARPLAFGLVAVSLGYLLVRLRVQDGLGFEPVPVFRFLRLGNADRIATMMTEIPRIARLLVFPTRLSADYSPQDVLVAHGADISQLAGLLLTLGVAGLAVALRRRAPVASFGLLWLIIAFLPVSNLLVPAGFITAERTLFLPSVGVLLVAGAVARWLRLRARPRELRLSLVVLSLLLLLGLVRSIDRQRVWKNNEIFANALVTDSPDGYRAHFIRGREIGFHKGDFAEMMREYHLALRLFPYDASMTLTMADGYTRAGVFKPAVDLFRWTYAVAPETVAGRYEYVYALSRLERWGEVRAEAMTGLRLVSGPDVQLMRKAIAYSDSVSGRGRFRPWQRDRGPVPQSARECAKSPSRPPRSPSGMVCQAQR